MTQFLQFLCGFALFWIAFIDFLVLCSLVVCLFSIAWHRWWLAVVVSSGQERYLSFVVVPSVTAFAGAGAGVAVGMDHVLSAESSTHGWYLMGGGLVLIVITGIGTLQWLRRGLSADTTVIARALHGGEGEAQAIGALQRWRQEVPTTTPPRWWPVSLAGLAGFIIVCGIALDSQEFVHVWFAGAQVLLVIVTFAVWRIHFARIRRILTDLIERIQSLPQPPKSKAARRATREHVTALAEAPAAMAPALLTTGFLAGWLTRKLLR